MACLKKRGEHFYAQIYIAGQEKRIALRTTSYKIAREKLRQIESTHAGGAANPLPTRTPIGQIVQKYVEHIRTVKTDKSAQMDVYYLRDIVRPLLRRRADHEPSAVTQGPQATTQARR